MNDNNSNHSNSNEIVFKIGAEGGSICITRGIVESGEKFYYRHREYDPIDESLEVSIDKEYNSFEEPFELINKKYTWYLLYAIAVHDDFKSYVGNRLVERLNKDSVNPENLQNKQYDWEDKLKTRLIYKWNQPDNFKWKIEKSL